MAFIEALRLPPGPVDLSAIDTKATPEWPGTSSDDKAAAKEALFEVGVELADLQERALRPRHRGRRAPRAAGPAGHGHHRQGRHRP